MEVYREDENAIKTVGNGKVRKRHVVECKEMELRHKSCLVLLRCCSMFIIEIGENAM